MGEFRNLGLCEEDEEGNMNIPQENLDSEENNDN